MPAEVGTDKVLALREARSAAAAGRATEARKTHEINVPRIKDGAIKGYAVMLLSHTVDLSSLRTAAMGPDSISSTKRSATSMTTTRSTSITSTGSISPR
jgi:hypothetical protein